MGGAPTLGGARILRGRGAWRFSRRAERDAGLVAVHADGQHALGICRAEVAREGIRYLERLLVHVALSFVVVDEKGSLVGLETRLTVDRDAKWRAVDVRHRWRQAVHRS